MIKQLKQYIPANEQEETDKLAIIEFVKNNPDAFYRTNLVGHITSSAIVVNRTKDKVLFAHHNIYKSWGWVGGHNDGDTDCLRVALKETMEETGVQNVTPYSEDILGVDIIFVNNHIKNGMYVGDHLHLNITYLLVADEEDDLAINEAEHSDVAWFPIDSVLEYVNEERMISVYSKLFKKIKSI